jgi:hypothetical protein
VLQVHHGAVQRLPLFYFKLNLIDKGPQIRLVLVSLAGAGVGEETYFFIFDPLVGWEDGVRERQLPSQFKFF